MHQAHIASAALAGWSLPTADRALAAAAEAGCRLLLSEDLQDGFTWSGVTVVNPFAEKKHELLAGILEP